MRGRRVTRHALTLLETVIALTLLVALSAVAIPSMLSRLDRVRADEARSRLQAAVQEALAESRRTGQAVRLSALGDDAPELRLSTLAPPVDDRAEATNGAPNDTPSARRVGALPAGASLRSPEPVDSSEPEDTEPAPAELVLGWALPDGTFHPAADLTLRLDHASLTLRPTPWTGRPLTPRAQPDEPEADTDAAPEGGA